MSDQNQEPKVSYKDKIYEFKSLPIELQEYIKINQQWDTEMGTLRREMFKLDAAIKSLNLEIEKRFGEYDAQNSL